ncbi:tyrosine--tRNA ligase [bacterium (Candidatus Torokbacteria) CG_4_10_14_0_2_um_filter_35_8]|nr:MAG: tyrosine--tRNA ligase [bacterium (Candidatus Torokbacteria) CG_4_10_14_0_2_um_filter_35_8]
MPQQSRNQKIKRFFSWGIAEIYPSKEALEKALKSGKKLKVYYGVDPSGAEIHLGHAVCLRKLKELQDLGWEIVMLIGDFTGRIGDPTGRSKTRIPLTHRQVLENAKTYKDQVSKILNFAGNNPTKIKFNSEWLDKLSFKEVIELSAHFTVQQMLERDMYQERIKKGLPIFLHEFLYPLMQGYDSVVLRADAELGGSDQTFNMLCGRTLMKELKNKERFVITCSLLTGNDGRKMSKSFHNTIPVTDNPFTMFGKTMAAKDEIMISYFELCTDIPQEEIKKIEKDLKNNKVNPRDVKARLAREIVTIYHGSKKAEKSEEEFNRVFRDKKKPTKAKEVKLSKSKWNITDLLVKLHLAQSKGKAKRLIREGAVKINNKKVSGLNKEVNLKNGDVVRCGKINFVKVSL